MCSSRVVLLMRRISLFLPASKQMFMRVGECKMKCVLMHMHLIMFGSSNFEEIRPSHLFVFLRGARVSGSSLPLFGLLFHFLVLHAGEVFVDFWGFNVYLLGIFPCGNPRILGVYCSFYGLKLNNLLKCIVYAKEKRKGVLSDEQMDHQEPISQILSSKGRHHRRFWLFKL